MKLQLAILLFLLLVGVPTFAQTTVNLSVSDIPDGQAWANGTWVVRIQLAANNFGTGSVPTLLSGGGSLNTQSGALDGTGSTSVSLPANANIGPKTVWQFTVCPQASAGCFQQSVAVGTSSPQALTINPPSIRINLAIAVPPVSAYSTTEISAASLGSQFLLIGTGLQICTAVSGNSCTTWQSGGGGISSVSTTIDAFTLGVKADWKEFFGQNTTITVTSGSATVTCNGCAVATDIGKLLIVTNPGQNDGAYTSAATVSMFPAGTTMAGVTPPNTITASQNATGSCTAAACWLAFGDDDDVAGTGAWTAVMNAVANAQTCTVVQLPRGITNWNSTGKMNLVSPNCSATGLINSNHTILTNGGTGFKGYGVGASTIILTPTFAASIAASGCPTGNYTINGCMFTIPDPILQDFSITGMGQNGCGAGAGSLISLEGGSVTNVNLSGFCGAGAANLFGVNGGFTIITGLESDGFGGVGFTCANGGPCVLNGTGSAGGAFLNNLNGNINAGSGGAVLSHHIGLGNSLTYQSGSAIYQCSTTCVSNNDYMVYTPTATYQFFRHQSATTSFTIRDFKDSIAVPTGVTGFYDGGGGTARFVVSNSDLPGGATGNTVNLASGSTFASGGFNTLKGTAKATGTFSFVPPPDRGVQGACTGVATAGPTTLGLYGTGPNVTLTTCTSAAIGAGKVMDHAGTAFMLKATATAGGVNASSGVVTVLKNGVATTVTCTIGTGTSCTDYTHTFTFVAGDLISINFTTQAAETLAGVTALVDLEF
jgi:hypothetical protein